ncbi:diacylglycerol/lipid kinase family protein [Mangrovibacterium diazotrophicum]|uniref:YegS/Rv2252/BmrU family lipid kinase n=1 Tax=Mangrovibacterium diazotrophicum TaxID=1261403 RepID=A0A419W897_9BACT|nr:diacylglycerol kinase family protein [Mangrovibacterium diazotrophicum]RKD91676.1 YegS/Rv2252/BmrU family lipid kinase [Mangrovibacterium diazotrophicum]
MERKYEFIVNPVAGPKDNVAYFKRLKAQLKERGIAFESKKTKRAGHAPKLVKKRLERSDAVIVSVGGDGTFNEAASVLVGTSREMAHIPRGSGNGLARMLNIPSKIEKIPDYLENGVARSIDVGQINNDYFFCTCGFGFDALIAHEFSDSTTRGLWTYVTSVLKKFWRFRGVEAKFVLDGQSYAGKYFVVTFANANQFGNDAFIAPDAVLDDGYLDVIMIRPFPLYYTPVVVAALFRKTIHKLPYVETRKVRTAEIHSVSSPYFHCDGDVYNTDLPVKITVKEKALNLLQPNKR